MKPVTETGFIYTKGSNKMHAYLAIIAKSVNLFKCNKVSIGGEFERGSIFRIKDKTLYRLCSHNIYEKAAYRASRINI